jgi:hypothetical protein
MLKSFKFDGNQHPTITCQMSIHDIVAHTHEDKMPSGVLTWRKPESLRTYPLKALLLVKYPVQ